MEHGMHESFQIWHEFQMSRLHDVLIGLAGLNLDNDCCDFCPTIRALSSTACIMMATRTTATTNCIDSFDFRTYINDFIFGKREFIHDWTADIDSYKIK